MIQGGEGPVQKGVLLILRRPGRVRLDTHAQVDLSKIGEDLRLTVEDAQAPLQLGLRIFPLPQP